MVENFRWVAAVVRRLSEYKQVTRLRLQKAIWLLQQLGLPTDYSYSIHFYGPYSAGLQDDVSLLVDAEILDEHEHPATAAGNPHYYDYRLVKDIELPDLAEWEESLTSIAAENTSVLELAATYSAFRSMGIEHNESARRLKIKKPALYEEHNLNEMYKLLELLGLPSS